MGLRFYWIVIGGIALLIGLMMFPSIKDIIGFNSTTGFGYLLNALYTSLPYAVAFFIGYAVWKAVRGNR